MQYKQFRLFCTIATVFALMLGGAMLIYAWTTNEGADVVVGHEFMAQGSTNAQDATEKTLNFPVSSYVNNGKLFIADTDNSRVLIFNTIPSADDAAADVVVGQPDMFSIDDNQNLGGGALCATNTLDTPQGVYATGTKLFIADTENHRVLIYNTIPTSNDAAADVVVGQTIMANNTSGTTATTLKRPYFVHAISGGKMVITDTGNHRLLIYNSIPSSNGAAADVAVGQANKTTGTANAGGLGAASLNGPNKAVFHNSKLYVADTTNHRVLIYNTIPAADGASADVVLGQANMTSNTSNQGGGVAANTLSLPSGVDVYGTQIFVADAFNHRALIYDMPVANNENADYVIGQANMTSNSADQGGSGAANTLDSPSCINSDGTNVYVADRNNSRVLIYTTPIAAADDSAEYAVGQADKTSTLLNRGGSATAYSLSDPRSAYSDGTKLYVADFNNNRVLIFNSIPTTNKTSADVVLGQADFSSSAVGCSATGMQSPTGVYADATNLYVVAYDQFRVLVYTAPYSTGMAASAFLGGSNATDCPGGIAANRFAFPYGIGGDATYVYVTSEFADRVLMFTKPVSTDQNATYVLGQPDKTTYTGTVLCVSTELNEPKGVSSDGTNLLVADSLHHRVLLWTSIPTADQQAADYVIGQSVMTSCNANQSGAVAANTLNAPEGVYTDGTQIFIADTGNNRVLVYNSIPAANNASADAVLGQADFSSNSSGTSANLYENPLFVMEDGSDLFVTDSTNNRVLIYNQPTSETGQVIRFW